MSFLSFVFETLCLIIRGIGRCRVMDEMGFGAKFLN